MIFYAPNIHTGGGMVLMQSIMDAWPEGNQCTAFLDERSRDTVQLPSAWNVHFCGPTIVGRLNAERNLAKVSTKNEVIFCFHNLPPIFPARGKIICYLQNANLVGLLPFGQLPGYVKVRTLAERCVLRLFRHRIDTFLVQTPTMQRALQKRYRGNVPAKIQVSPFIDAQHLCAVASPTDQLKWDFLYVSDGIAHKNHFRLFDAWVLLAKEGSFPSLALTLPPRDSVLIDRLEALKAEHSLNIVNLGHLPHDDLLKCYRQAGALLFASYAESFGIPLLEAKAAALPIIAAELDFVRDICEPVQTFDPFSERSIVRAVKRHLKLPADQMEPLDASRFVAMLFDL